MTAAVWVVSMFLVVVITLLVMGYMIRPHIQALATDRDLWRERALELEGNLGRDDGLGDVKLIDAADAGLPWQQFLKGEI